MNQKSGAPSEETALDDYTRTLLETLQPAGEQVGDPGFWIHAAAILPMVAVWAICRRGDYSVNQIHERLGAPKIYR